MLTEVMQDDIDPASLKLHFHCTECSRNNGTVFTFAGTEGKGLGIFGVIDTPTLVLNAWLCGERGDYASLTPMCGLSKAIRQAFVLSQG